MGKNRTNKAMPYLFVLPCFVFLIIFIYIPLVQNIFFSTKEFTAVSPTKTDVGFQNYIYMLTDPVVKTALKNNVWYAVISMLFQVCLGLVVAAVLEDKVFRKISPVLRTVYFMPVVISTTVIGLLFTFIYNPQGILNKFLELINLGALAQPWIGQAKTAPFAVIAMSQWHSMGYIIMLFIVDIQKIPADLYEAAEIDGAGKLRRFLHITIPQTKEMFFVSTITTLSGAFTVFNDPYVLTQGGPGNASTTLALYVYKNAFPLGKMGYASALSVVMLVIIMIIAVIQMYTSKTGAGD